MTVSTTSRSRDAATPAASGRFELLRALGSLTALHSGAAAGITATLDLPPWTRAEHTRLFVLELPPYASIHLGPEGKLGGEGADRVAGCWRALGMSPPADADHLANVLGLYAELGEAAEACRTPAARTRLDHARESVLWEHLWSWVPGYLDAVHRASPAAGRWSRLVAAALAREVDVSAAPHDLPLALRAAPPPVTAEMSLGELLDALTTPVRSGFVLTQGDLAGAAGVAGVGVRRGERRFALRAMLEQDSAATLRSLSDHAHRWAALHAVRPAKATDPHLDPSRWWASRAATSASVLRQLADESHASV
ncbi:MAG: molecular chaperone TorD family protein [Acidimicrobiales bacterium]